MPPLNSEISQNSQLQALIGDAVRGIENIQMETNSLKPEGFHVANSPTHAPMETLLRDNSIAQAQQVLQNHMGEQTTPGSDDKPYPTLQSAGTLKEGMHGITRSEEGSTPLIITYSFGKNEAMKKYEAAPFTVKQVDANTYQTFSEEERQMMRETFDEFEAEANVKYVEVNNPMDAYLAVGKYDLSQQENIHNGVNVGVGGQAIFPQQEGGYLVISTAKEMTKQDLIHELMHNHGAYHTHQSREINFYAEQFDTYNASTMAYGYSAKGTPADAWIGGNSHQFRMGDIQTLQTLDIQYLQQHHGLAPARDPKLFVLDGKDKFFGTFPIQEGDTFELKNAGEGVLDLRGGIENTSLLAQNDVKKRPNPYGNSALPDKKMFWMTDTPAETQIEGGHPVIIMGDKPSRLTLENSDAQIILGGAASTIDLGDGAETIITSEGNIPVLLTDFNPAEDSIRYSESVTHHELKAINDTNIALNLFEDENQVGQIIIEGTSLTALQTQTASISSISNDEKAALMNGKRPALQIQSGDNGLISGYDPKFHSLQYNEKFERPLVSEITYAVGQTHITLRNSFGNDLSPMAKFSVEGEHYPKDIALFNTGRKTEIAHAKFTQNGATEIWAQDNGELYHYRDRRNLTHPGFGLKSGEVFVINGDNNHSISQFDIDQNKGGSHIYRSQGNDASGALEVTTYKRGEIISINRFDTSKDTLSVEAGDTIQAIKLHDDGIGLVISGTERDNTNKQSFIYINKLVGNIKDVKGESLAFDKPDAPLKHVSIHAQETEQTNLHIGEQYLLEKLESEAASIEQNIENHYPDVNIAPERAAPAIPEIPNRSGGRGR